MGRLNFKGHRIRISLLAGAVLVGLLLLALLPCCADAFDVNFFHKMNIDRHPEHSTIVDYRTTKSLISDDREWVHGIVQSVLWYFVGDKSLPDGYVTAGERGLEYGPKAVRHEWGGLLKQYWLALIVMLLLVVLMFAVPIAGLCICVSRCNGACLGKRKSKTVERLHRVGYAVLLMLLSVGIFFGVFAAFITTSQLQRGLDGFTSSVRDGRADIRSFMGTTAKQVNHVLVVDYRELIAQLELILENTFTIILNELEQESMSMSFRHLTDFTNHLPEVKQKLRRMQTIMDVLAIYRSELKETLRDSKRYLIPVLTKCNKYMACKEIMTKYEIRDLDANIISYKLLPNIKDIIDSSDRLIDGDIAATGNRGRAAFEVKLANLRRTIEKFLPPIVDAMNKTGSSIELISQRINVELEQVTFVINNITDKLVRVMYVFLNEYRRATAMGSYFVIVVLFTIPCLLLLSLLCGLWPPRTTFCCNKGAGSRMLVLTVNIIILTMSAIIIVALIHFVLGLFMYRGVCMPLRDHHNDMFKLLDTSIDLNREMYSPLSPPLRLSHMIAACHENRTIFEVLHLRNRSSIYRIDFPSMQKINLALDNLVNSIDFDDSNLQILSDADRQRLVELGDSALRTFDAQSFLDTLNASTTRYPLGEIAQQLRLAAKQIGARDQRDVQVILHTRADRLDECQQHLVAPMQQQEERLRELVDDLWWGLHYKDLPIRESLARLINDTAFAEAFIHEKSRFLVKAIAKNLTQYFADEVDQYLVKARYSVERGIGNCQPLALVYDASIMSLCNLIVDPLNGFWIAVFWSILMLLGMLIVAIPLANLYRNAELDANATLEDGEEPEEENLEENEEDNEEED